MRIMKIVQYGVLMELFSFGSIINIYLYYYESRAPHIKEVY